jgi:hypothetical protein
MMMFAGDPATTVITFKEQISAGSVIYILHINSLNVTEMQLLGIFIIVTALHVSGTSRPSSGAYENFKCRL